MAEAMNRQVTREFYSGYLYLQMAAWFEEHNFKGFAHWMRIQAQEEAAHALILFNHLAARGAKISLGAIDAPPGAYKSAADIFEATLKHERSVTAAINELVDLALEVKDHAARVILDTFVSEQVEEEANAQEILEKAKAFGDNHPALLALDASLSSRAFSLPAQLAAQE
jgi:ferritin